jgi:hypothetical protein
LYCCCDEECLCDIQELKENIAAWLKAPRSKRILPCCARAPSPESPAQVQELKGVFSQQRTTVTVFNCTFLQSDHLDVAGSCAQKILQMQ